MHGRQRLRLKGDGLADPGQRVGDAGRREGHEFHRHQPARARRVEAHQGQHLGPLAGRQQVEDRLARATAAVRRSRPRRRRRAYGEHVGDLLVGAGAQQSGGQVLIEFLEDVGLELRVGVHLARGSRSPPPWRPPRSGRRSGRVSACGSGRTGRAAARCPAWPISHSKRASRGSCRPPRVGSRGPSSPNSRRGLRRVSTPASTHSSPSLASSRSAARTRRAFSTSMSRWPRTSRPEQHFAFAALEVPQVEPGA